jgi:hypothetical protein
LKELDEAGSSEFEELTELKESSIKIGSPASGNGSSAELLCASSSEEELEFGP